MEEMSQTKFKGNSASPTPPTRKGRPPAASRTENEAGNGVKIESEGDYLVIKVPKKVALKKLLGELI
jgi:hypothetical protein